MIFVGIFLLFYPGVLYRYHYATQYITMCKNRSWSHDLIFCDNMVDSLKSVFPDIRAYYTSLTVQYYRIFFRIMSHIRVESNIDIITIYKCIQKSEVVIINHFPDLFVSQKYSYHIINCSLIQKVLQHLVLAISQKIV